MNRKHEILVGAFTLAGIALIVVGALWLADRGFGARPLELTARFQTVGQLRPGNPVTLRGVSVGRVERITLAPDGGAVEVTFGLDPEVALPEVPVAVLQPGSLFGDWQAALVPAAERPEVDPDTLDLPADRIAGVTLAAFSDISESSREIAENLRGLTERFRVAFDENTAQDVSRAIANVTRASDELVGLVAEQREEFASFSADMIEAGRAVRDAAVRVDSVMSRLAAATEAGRLEATFEDARGASSAMREVSEHLQGTVRALDRGIARADSASAELLDLLASVNRGEGSIGLLARDREMYENVVAALEELQALLDDLKRNPNKYFNFSIF